MRVYCLTITARCGLAGHRWYGRRSSQELEADKSPCLSIEPDRLLDGLHYTERWQTGARAACKGDISVVTYTVRRSRHFHCTVDFLVQVLPSFLFGIYVLT